MNTGRLKVVSIAHGAARRAIGRIRYERLQTEFPDIDLTLVAPERWQEYGKSMTIEPASHGLDIRIEPVRMQAVPRAGWYLHHYPRLRALLTEIRPDVIHLWEEPWSIVALQAAHLRRKLLPGSALILETDQNILRRLPFPFEQIRRMTLRQTDLLIGRQEESLQVSRACGFDGPTAIVEYGVDGDIFHPAQDPKIPAPHSPFILGYVGRIVREKGLHDVLDAMAQPVCQKLDRPVSLFVLGDGPDRAALEAYAAQLGLADRLQFFAPRPPAAVAEFMRDLDVLMLMSRTTASWKEQFGRVIMEAQACGTPVIGSSSGSIPSVVGEGGWIVAEGDGVSLAEVIGRLANSPDEVAAARLAGLDQANSRYSFDTVARSLGQAMHAAARRRRDKAAAQTGPRSMPLNSAREHSPS